MPDARTPLHHWHAAHGARFAVRDGWQVVAAYSDPETEAAAARAGLGVADVTAFAEASLREPGAAPGRASFWLIGPRLDELLRRLTHLDVRQDAFPVGSSAETAFAGAEALLARIAADSLRVSVPWDVTEYVWERMLEAGRDLGIAPIGLEALRLAGVAVDGAE